MAVSQSLSPLTAMPMTGSAKPSATSVAVEALAVGQRVEADDRVGERLDRRAAGAVAIGVALADDDAALVVERHRDGIDDERIGGDQLDLESFGTMKCLICSAAERRFLILPSLATSPDLVALTSHRAACKVPWGDGCVAEDHGVGPALIGKAHVGPAIARVVRDAHLGVRDDEGFVVVDGPHPQDGQSYPRRRHDFEPEWRGHCRPFEGFW